VKSSHRKAEVPTAKEVVQCHTHTLSVLYGTQTGVSKKFAGDLVSMAEAAGICVTMADLKDCDPEDTLTQEVSGVSDGVGESSDISEISQSLIVGNFISYLF